MIYPTTRTHSRHQGSRAAPLRSAWLTLLAIVLYVTSGFAHGGSQVRTAAGRAAAQKPTTDSSQPLPGPARADIGALPPSAKAKIFAAIGEHEEGYHAVARARGFQMDNADHGLSAEFTSKGVDFRLGANRWNLAFRGYGYGDALSGGKQVIPHAKVNRVEYQRGVLTEWYVNGPLGLEQGFTIQRAPEGSNGQPLTLSFNVGGDLTASVDEQSRNLTLSKGGAAMFRYAGLTAWDANGRELRTWLASTGTQLRLHVDDAGARYPVTIDPVVQANKLVAQTMLYGVPTNDGVANDQLGRSVAMSADGSTVVVGAPFKKLNGVLSGVAYVFVRPPAQEGGWNSTNPMYYANRLQPSDFATSGLMFGLSVAVSADGGTIIVGATGAAQFTKTGAVYIYVRTPGYWGGGWALAQTAKLLPGYLNQYSTWGSFGTSVDIADDGATIIVGSPNHGTADGVWDGAAHVFFQPTSGWALATESYRIRGWTETGYQYHTRFGSSVSISGNRTFVAVGAPGEWEWRGAAYTFTLATRPYSQLYYRQVQKFWSFNEQPYEAFGASVSLNGTGDTLAIGEPGAVINGIRPGSVTVYQKLPNGGPAWYTMGVLTITNGSENDSLGEEVSLSSDGNTIVAGSSDTSDTTPGAAYMFRKPASGWTSATETAKVTASDGLPGNRFGSRVATAGDGAAFVVGSPWHAVNYQNRQGAAYVFTPDTPFASVNPTSLSFGGPSDGADEGPQSVTLTNTGLSPLSVTSVAVTGPFTATQNCFLASPLAPGASCVEQVGYTPPSSGQWSGTLTFTDDSGGSPGATQQVSLFGQGVKVNTTTAVTAASANPALAGQPVTVSFAVTPQAGAIGLPSGTVTVLASTGESCTGSAPSGSCAITFATAADRTLTAGYSGDTEFKPSTSPAVSLKVVDFGLSVSPPSQNVVGRKATYAVTVTGQSGFAGAVSLSCSGGPAGSTCAMSPASITLPGTTTTSNATVTLPGNAPAGSYVITFSGSFGGATRTATATLIK